MFSYLYYTFDVSPIQDEKFDLLCARLLQVFDTIKHPHKKLIIKDDLVAGSGFAIKAYPTSIRGAAMEWLVRNHKEMYDFLNNQTR